MFKTILCWKLRCCIFITLCLCTFASSAGCRGPATPGVATATLPQEITISRYVTPGTTLYDSGWVQGTQGRIENCDEWSQSWDAWTIWDGGGVTPSSYGHDIYNTNKMGIGIRVTSEVDISDSPWGNSVFPITDTYTSYACGAFGSKCSSPYKPNSKYRVELIATADGNLIARGQLAFPSPVASINFHQLVGTQLNLTNSKIMLKSASCDFSTTSKALNFNIGQVNASNFTGVNSVWPVKGTEADATLTATCDAGTNLNLKLSGTTVGTDDSAIALSQDSTAQGFGVQFLYAGEPMHINSTLSVNLDETETQFNLNSLVARYIQTSPQIKAGSANAAAVLTVSYD